MNFIWTSWQTIFFTMSLSFIRKKGEYLIRSFMMCNEYFLIYALFHHFSFFSLFFVMKISWYWQFLTIFFLRPGRCCLDVMNFSTMLEIFMIKTSRFWWRIMKYCYVREIFIIQKSPVMRNCLYREIFMTKNSVSWKIAKNRKFSLRTLSAEKAFIHKAATPDLLKKQCHIKKLMPSSDATLK